MISKDNAAPRRLIKAAGSNIKWSSGQAWDGLIIEKCFPAETAAPEFKISDFGLLIRLSPDCAGKSRINSRDSVNRPAEICLFPTGLLPLQLCVHHQQEVLMLTLAPEVVRRAAHELRVNLKSCLTERHQMRDAQVEHIGKALETEAENGYLSGRLYGESLGTALAVHLLSKYAAAKPDFNAHKGGMSPPTLRRVIEYIDSHLTDDIKLSSLAKVANLSQFRFAHNFKKATGISPHQYVIRERLERAKKMLRETDLTVTTIAYAVGCGSPSRFTVLFRRATGVIPSVYRSSYR